MLRELQVGYAGPCEPKVVRQSKSLRKEEGNRHDHHTGPPPSEEHPMFSVPLL